MSRILPLAQSAPLGPFETTFVRLVDADALGPGFVAVALVTALVVGALHAFAPGHGKAVAAAYLVGGRAKPRDALLLGAAVAIMHTASVLVLGLALHGLATGARIAEDAGPWLTLAAGVLVVAVGAGSLVRLLRRRQALSAGQVPAEHAHGHALPPGVSPLSRHGLLLIGLSGGLLPSPSAFLVLTTALFMGRTLFGLALVAAFSVGLAATLGGLGLAVLYGREAVVRRTERSPRLAASVDALPLVSALVVTVAGVWLSATALRGL